MPRSCIGRMIEIFYMSQSGELSIRRISIKSMKDGIVKAVIADSGQWRTFRVERILSWEFVK